MKILFQKIKDRRWFGLFLLVVIIGIQLGRTTYEYAYVKEGNHSDELWVYGLANSSNGPHIYREGADPKEKYANEWVDSKVFRDYLMVSEEERFTYGNVTANLKQDTAPPLYAWILHTVCSFFPNTYSKWYAYWIGAIAFILTQLLLYLLAKEIFGRRLWAYLAVAFYGFSIGAVDSIVFARHYSLLILFSVLMLYGHVKLIKSQDKKSIRKWIIVSALSTFFGAMTHYFFIVFAFGIGLMFFGWYLLHKNYKNLVYYTLAMLAAILLTLPFCSLGSMLTGGSGSGEEASTTIVVLKSGIFSNVFGMLNNVVNMIYDPLFEERANIVLGCFLRDFFGVSANPQVPYFVWHGCFIALALFLLWKLLAIYVTQKEKSLKETKYVLKLKSSYTRMSTISCVKFFLVASLVAVLFESYIVMCYGNPIVMCEATNRYLMLTYPAVAIFMIIAVKKIVEFASAKAVKFVKYQTVTILSVIFLISLANNYFGECLYLFPRGENYVKIEEEVKGKDVILSMSSHWLLTTYTEYMMDANRVFVTSDNAIYSEDELLRQVETEEFIIIQDTSSFVSVQARRNACKTYEVTREMVESQYMPNYKRAYPDKTIEYIGSDSVFTRKVNIYRVY